MILLSNKEREDLRKQGLTLVQSWRDDWNKFAYEALGARMDSEQRKILDSVQWNPRTSVSSGTARGKDYLTSVAVICFMYMTPIWNEKGIMIANTKVALTAPTGRQITNIMKPEFARHFKAAKRNGIDLPGRLVAADIRTDDEEWFLTGFKADDNAVEAWTGFHAVNTMFAITEATGISQMTYEAIEGNLQGNSRILLVFNPNVNIGYAAESQKSARWSKFRLNSMDAPNIVARQNIIPGQVDIAWLIDKIENWCTPIHDFEADITEDDFQFDIIPGVFRWYRPEDIFRVKVLGKFPKVSEDSLIPEQWIELAQQRWVDYHNEHGQNPDYPETLRMGLDVAGMGRDSSVFCPRYGNIVAPFYETNSGGRADHAALAGRTANILTTTRRAIVCIDTIGEGAGVYSILIADGYEGQAFSTKFSNKAKDEFDNDLTDVTGEHRFENMRAYLFWCVRDFLNPKNGYNAMLPPGDRLKREATEIKFFWKSSGKIMIEPKEDIKKRLGFSIDYFDSLANTFDNVYFSENIDKSYLF